MRFEVETNIYNPSALSRKFSSIQTQFDVTLGKISAVISDSDIEQYTDGHTTMNTKLSATIQDLEGFHQTVSQMQTTYNGNFTSINSQLSTLEQTISGISASVSSVSQNAIKSDTIHYLATSFSSGVTRNTAGWTDTPQSITATNRYLWIYHTYTRGDNSTVNTDPVIAGVWGNTGVTITSVTPLYYVSNSTTPPSEPSSKITSNTIATMTWTTAVPALSTSYPYMYTCDQIEWEDNNIIWSDVVRDNALTDLVSRVSVAELKITDSAIVSTVRSSMAYQNDLSSKNTTYTGDYKPTASNTPASSWTTTALKESHLNDTFLTSAGELYQYIYGCYGLMITFDDLSETESASFDYVEVYYRINETTYVLPRLGGTEISGKNIFVPASEFWLYWKSDRSITKYGFKIKNIKWEFNASPSLTTGTLPSMTPTELSGTDYPETTHPYTNDEEKFWKYSTSNTGAGTLSYGWSLRSDPNKTSASEVNSIIEQKADSIRLKADKISWQSTYSSMTEDGVLTCRGAAINGDVTMSGDDITVTVGDRYVPVSSGYGNPYSKQYLEGLLYEKNNSNNAKIAMKFLGYYDSANMLNESIVTSYYGYTRTITCNRVGSSGIPSDFNNSNACHVQEMLYQPSSYGTPTYLMTLYSGNFKRLASMGLTYKGFDAVGYYNSDTTIQAELSVEYGKNIYCYNNIGGLVIEQSRTYIGKTRGGLPADSGVSGLFVYHPNGVTGYFTIGDVSGENHLYGSLNTNNPFLKHGGKYVQFQSSSSKRYKHDIKLLQDNALDPHKLLELPVKQFVYNDDIKLQYGDMRDKIIPGFIAEEVDEIYPIAIIHDIDGKVESWDERRIIPGMLSLIQELYEKIEDLERRL